MWGQWLQHSRSNPSRSLALTRRRLGATIVTVTLAGCTNTGQSTTAEETTSPSDTETTDELSHPDLAPVLTPVIAAEDPARYARERGYNVDNGAIEVVVEVREGTELPGDIVVSVVSEYENHYGAFVRFDDLLPLAKHENVTSVRPPEKASTHTND
jgi:hypothetical protein